MRFPSRDVKNGPRRVWAHPLPRQAVLSLHWCFRGPWREWAGSDCVEQLLLIFAAQFLTLWFRYFPTLLPFSLLLWGSLCFKPTLLTYLSLPSLNNVPLSIWTWCHWCTHTDTDKHTGSGYVGRRVQTAIHLNGRCREMALNETTNYI